jgi:type I restriction enzyme S subunit
MVNNWGTKRIDEIAQVVDSRHKTPQYSDDGYPMVRVVDVKGGVLQLKETKKVNEEVYTDFSKGRDPEIGDLIISRVGSYGNVAYVNSIEKFCLGQNTALIIPEDKSRYLYYALTSPQIKAQIEEMVVGAVQKTISLKTIKNIKIPEPPAEVKKKISKVLSTIDDKIELNRQTNQTLEEMAQTLFKSWFVDFDPVFDNALAAGTNVSDFPEALQQRALLRQERRKQAQQLAASPEIKSKPLPDDICNLFPNEFEQSDEPSIGINGWIPKGWQKGEFSDLIILQRGFDLPKSNRTDGLYPLIASSGQDGTHCESKVDGPGVVTGRSGKLGKVVFVKDNFWPLNTTLWVKKYLLSNPYHAYFYLQTLPLEEFNSGSAVPSLNRNHVHNVRCYLPPKGLTEAFKKCVCENFEKIDHNIKQIKHLEKLRDTLLPKLISGELTIQDSIKTENNVNHQQPKEPLYNHA